MAASNIDDERAHFSNIGPCITLFAPGVHVPSDWLDGQTEIVNGTSFSAACTAGVAALVLGVNPTQTPAQLKAFLLEESTPNQVAGTAGGCNPGGRHCLPATPNSMVFNGCGPSPNGCVLQPPLPSPPQ